MPPNLAFFKRKALQAPKLACAGALRPDRDGASYDDW